MDETKEEAVYPMKRRTFTGRKGDYGQRLYTCLGCGKTTRRSRCSACRKWRREEQARDAATGRHLRRMARQKRAR